MAYTSGWKLWPEKGLMAYSDQCDTFWETVGSTCPVMDAEWAWPPSAGRGPPPPMVAHHPLPVATSRPGMNVMAAPFVPVSREPASPLWPPPDPTPASLTTWGAQPWGAIPTVSPIRRPAPRHPGTQVTHFVPKPRAAPASRLAAHSAPHPWTPTVAAGADLYASMRHNNFTHVAPLQVSSPFSAPIPAGRQLCPVASPRGTQSIGSDRTIGHSDSEGDPDGASTADMDGQLIQCILDYFGDCKGSLPSERVQNIIKKEHRALYDAVFVSARFGKKWHKFLNHYPETFRLFTVPSQPLSDQDYCWRIRLANNPDWEAADHLEEEHRAEQEKTILERLHTIVNGRPNQECPMAEVIHELNRESGAEDSIAEAAEWAGDADLKVRKIRVNDLKRIMRRHPSGIVMREYHPEGNPPRCVTYLALEGSQPSAVMP